MYLMKKKLFLTFFFILFFILFLSSKSYQYIGVDGNIKKIKITNFQKISDFYKRHINYNELVRKIIDNSKNDKKNIIDISSWVYKNIKKITTDDVTIDKHPWTIVERKLGAADQFSDILSVLLVHANIDSFFIMNIDNKIHPFTFFKYQNEWSIIDPYYGIYFINREASFSTLEEIKNEDFIIQHLIFKEINKDNLNEIFFDKKFKNTQELNDYYKHILRNIPSSSSIDDTNIYERGGRSYIQKPLHRILIQLKRLLKFNSAELAF